MPLNNTILNIMEVRADAISPSSWMCDYHQADPGGFYLAWEALQGGRGRDKRMQEREDTQAGEVQMQFSLGTTAAVVSRNLVKACSMIMAVVRSREPTLVTLGDAMDSFLRIPDPTTAGMCSPDRRFAEREWRHGWRTGPRQWKEKGVQRWWTNVSRRRWITCNFFSLVTIIVAGVLLRMGIVNDGLYWSTDIKSMWTRGFGKVNSGSLLGFYFGNTTQAILLDNLPQTILSFLYLTYNSLFTCMLSGHEWSLFSHHHRTHRVIFPRPGQRSTYWLQIPYTYAIPLISMSGLLHWLISQSIFFARIEVSDPLGEDIYRRIITVGYSCIAIISVLTLGLLALLIAAGTGCRKFSAETTTIGSCSAAISALAMLGRIQM
ncbi:hypothetical protein HOY80DRAFT_1057272 [Tuber brumale]|nr:hypothetical protein HOY80DRAFT_1057272 [Tuber brumale]